MSQEQSPSPEQQPLIAQKQAGDILSKDPIAIQEALRYLDEAIPTWVLEPAEVVVEQPSNQSYFARFKTGALDNPLSAGRGKYIDTSVRPYSPEIDLSSIATTSPEMKGKAHPLSVIDIDSSEITQQELRDMLAGKYPEADYPDIHKILKEGLVLTRFVNEERLPQVLMSGTDRDLFSQLAYQGEVNEEEVVRVNNLNIANVTYLAQQRTSNRSFNGGESTMNFGGFYGNVLLVYDPRQVQRLGSTSSGLSYFPTGAHAALLAIV